MEGTRRHARARRRRARLAVMWSIIGVVILGVIGFSAGAATGFIPIFATPAPWPTSAVTASETAAAPTTTPEVPEPSTSAPAPVPSPTPAPPIPCAVGTTMSVMAHYDDDLIFANPTIANAIAGGQCVRTVFITAGDAGSGMTYATSRESGILHAYDVLRGVEGAWAEEHVVLATGLPITRFTPADDPDIAVTFLRLPDGNLRGEGFEATGWESLARLNNQSLAAIHTVDTATPVSLDLLKQSVSELISAAHPTTLITLVPGWSWAAHRDHSDHSTVGALVRDAAQAAGLPVEAMRYATGYGNKDKPANVTGDALDLKLRAFFEYTQYDHVMQCGTPVGCLDIKMFGRSLEREYFLTDAEL